MARLRLPPRLCVWQGVQGCRQRGEGAWVGVAGLEEVRGQGATASTWPTQADQAAAFPAPPRPARLEGPGQQLSRAAAIPDTLGGRWSRRREKSQEPAPCHESRPRDAGLPPLPALPPVPDHPPAGIQAGWGTARASPTAPCSPRCSNATRVKRARSRRHAGQRPSPPHVAAPDACCCHPACTCPQCPGQGSRAQSHDGGCFPAISSGAQLPEPRQSGHRQPGCSRPVRTMHRDRQPGIRVPSLAAACQRCRGSTRQGRRCGGRGPAVLPNLAGLFIPLSPSLQCTPISALAIAGCSALDRPQRHRPCQTALPDWGQLLSGQDCESTLPRSVWGPCMRPCTLREHTHMSWDGAGPARSLAAAAAAATVPPIALRPEPLLMGICCTGQLWH